MVVETEDTEIGRLLNIYAQASADYAIAESLHEADAQQKFVVLRRIHRALVRRFEENENLAPNIEAVLRLISPDHITPVGRRQVEKVLARHTEDD